MRGQRSQRAKAIITETITGHGYRCGFDVGVLENPVLMQKET